MSSLVLNSVAGHSEGHKYVYDIQALNHNTKRCRFLAQQCGFSMRVVLKGGYLHPNIVGELTQDPDLRFALGKDDRNVLNLLRGRDVATLYPGQRLQRSQAIAFNRIVAADVSNLNKPYKSVKPKIIIAVATSENREGLDCKDIEEFLVEIEDRFQIGGFQMNFGCLIDAPPDVREVQLLLNILNSSQIASRLVKSPVMSIGGSAILPILAQLDVPQNFHRELRLGEAILTGSVPGGQYVSGLRPTSFATTKVLQELCSDHEGNRRVLLDVGHTVLDDHAVNRDYGGMIFESLSSDVGVLKIFPSRRTNRNATISLPLNYRETERALARYPKDISFLASQSTCA